VAISAKMGSG